MKSQDWYDYPQYYDLAFRDETGIEADFLEAACRKYCKFPVRRMLEPGCGGGRLVVELASRGYHVTGFDLNEKSLDYARRCLQRRRLQAEIFSADMTTYSSNRPFDAAFNTYNTFRHLISEQAAESHLRCMAKSIRPGGIYVLGFHLLPLDADEECIERWTAKTGQTKITYTLRVLHTDRRQRIERLRVNMRVKSPRWERDLRLMTEFPLRMYTATQARKLFSKVPEFKLCDVYDFCYEIEHPLKLDDEISDTVFILKRQ